MTGFTLVTPPAVEPVTLDEAKAQARIDGEADDALVTALIVAARQWAERYTGRAFITQGWKLALDACGSETLGWWDGVHEAAVMAGGARFIALPRPPLVAVTEVTVFDDADTGAVWGAGNYFVDNAREPGRLVLRNGAVWPAPGRASNGIVISYNAGYGADAAMVPEPLRLAIKQLVAHWYEHRGEAVVVSTRGAGAHLAAASVPLVIQALLDPYRMMRV